MRGKKSKWLCLRCWTLLFVQLNGYSAGTVLFLLDLHGCDDVCSLRANLMLIFLAIQKVILDHHLLIYFDVVCLEQRISCSMF